MSKQPEAAKQHAEPVPCKMGCGFFGNNATGDCCSKCWALVRPKDEATVALEEPKRASPEAAVSSTAPIKCASSESPAPVASLASNIESATETVSSTMNTDGPTPTADPVTDAVMASPAKKKKKKKASYKNMMNGMLEGTSASRDIEMEKEKLREVTGGGHFSKIDKI